MKPFLQLKTQHNKYASIEVNIIRDLQQDLRLWVPLILPDLKRLV
jgi:hypothetical protein